MWTRSRHKRDPRNFREEIGGRALGKIGLFYWLLVFGWICLRSIAYGFSLLISTVAGRTLGIAAVVALLVDASWGADPVNLPASWMLVILLAGIAGFVMWTQRRRWESQVENAIYHVVPGHSRSEPEKVWYLPSIGHHIQGGRWLRTWNFGFRVPMAMRESDELDVATHLRSRLPAAEGASWMIRWGWRRGHALVKLISDVPTLITYPELPEALRMYAGGGKASADVIPIGVSIEGIEYWEPEEVPHCLFGGTTGGGKSNAQRTVLAHVLRHVERWTIYGIDPKRVELAGLRGYPNVETVATDVEEMAEVIESAYEEMKSRYKAMEEAGRGDTKYLEHDPHGRRILVVVDELADITAVSGIKNEEAKAEDEMAKRMSFALDKIAAQGRAAAVHLLLCTQRPDVADGGVMSGKMRHNIGGRLACGRMDGSSSRMILRDSEAAAEIGAQRGRGAWSPDADPRELQLIRTDPADLPAKEEVAV